MERFALVIDGTVREIFSGGPVPLNERFHASIVDQCRPAPENVQPGWTFDGQDWAPPSDAPPHEMTTASLVAAVDAEVERIARTMKYNSAVHCASYRHSTVPQWAAEATAFIAWRDAVWATIYALDPEAPPASFTAALALPPEWVAP